MLMEYFHWRFATWHALKKEILNIGKKVVVIFQQ